MGDTASRSNPTVKTQAFDSHSIFDRGQCCPARSEMSRVRKCGYCFIFVHFWSVCYSLHPSEYAKNCHFLLLLPMTWQQLRNKKNKIQVTENRNLLLLEVFPQSRRFCIISYKSPIQTELMEYTLKQPSPPWPWNSHANKMYKYKEEENCKIHSLSGMGCWNISKVLQECETCNYGLYLLCGVKFAMLISDTEKLKKKYRNCLQ